MFNKYVGGKKGFGLISIMMMLLFSTIATSSMYIASVYVRYKANENYHYRKALFALKGEIDTYRRKYEFSGFKPFSHVANATIDDVGSQRPIIGNIVMNMTPKIADIQVAPNAVYDKMIWSIEWKEPLIINDTIVRTKKMKLLLREDFYHVQTTLQ